MKLINPKVRWAKQRLVKYFALLSIFGLYLAAPVAAQNGKIVATDLSQSNFLKAYKLVFDLADNDYRGTSASMDATLFPKFGEYSVYWVLSGANQGGFVVPDAALPAFSTITTTDYSNYNWQAANHRSVQFKKIPKKVAIFKSKIETDGYSINWEAQYFKNLFETFLYKDVYYFVNEDDLTRADLSDSTDLLIVPAFNVHSKGEKYYIDSIFKVTPNIKSRIDNFLAKGKMVYTEGNAVYFVQKAGYLAADAVDFNDKVSNKSNLIDLGSFSATNPIAFAHSGVKDKLYGTSFPKVNVGAANVIAKYKTDSRPVIFAKSGSDANGGRIVCNLGIPTVGGISDLESGSRQLQWSFNTLLYAFSHSIDVTRKVWNQMPATVLADENSVSYDRVDTFEVSIRLRNLTDQAVSGIKVKEDFRKYFKCIVSEGGASFNADSTVLTFASLSIPAYGETVIKYKLVTPKPESDVHEKVDKLLDYESYMAASVNTTSYSDAEGSHGFGKRKNYANIMFSARLFGDADINWKNFLGLDWQPFKVFMIMENKERTQAENTVYTQYVPKDMPFYRSDGDLNIPVVKTPGGTFIDILKGSTNLNTPEFDMDGDGYPDVWLDTASIYPKGYTIVEESVYWANPWKTLKANMNNKPGEKDTTFYEDIDHDGLSGIRVNDVDYNVDPDDKIRAWKITWPIGVVKGNDYFDPYCSLEVWVDPPDMVAMAQGVSYAYGVTPKKNGFYPYKTLDGAKANHSDTDCWKHWMDKKGDGTVKWIDMYHQKMYNYQGYAFMEPGYVAKAWDKYYASVPKPHEEFLAVISMGGEEIDMYHPTPSQSLYSKIDYKTIFNEQRVTPIRTTYSFYAPLPNPMQFEYLASNYSISDTLNNPLTALPAKGKAKLRFDLDASTEYSYYWIRNAGHVVERKPSWIKDPVAGMGSGVFGYMIYEIPKGMGGYKITLPKKADGSYDTDAIMQVDGKNFEKWLTNPNTGNAIEIWEDPFRYQIYIPQLLIPPALSDKNKDGVDDWIDDMGDRYQSGTGDLHDAFMPGNGESYPEGSPNVYSHVDDGVTITRGWSSGPDNTYGSDQFEELGRTHFTINALYEGKGKEGPVDISKGGTLVVEEIFGGSPWVIFSHVLTANAEGVDYKITSSASPTSVKYGIDTVCIKHTIVDDNEPHEFNGNYDPYRASFGSSRSTVTSMAGGKDPCDWVFPNYATTTLIDPAKDHKTDVTLIPGASKSAALTAAGYPKKVSGTFLQIKVEVINGDIENGLSYEWTNTTVKPDLSKAGASKVVLSYVSYPRPLVPGDQPATDTTGWRFNQPEGEVIIQFGDTLKSRLQATRRAYFVFLVSIDETLKKGIYDIGFTLSGERKNYKGTSGGKLSMAVAPVKFSIVEKGDNNKPKEFRKFRIGEGSLKSLASLGTNYFEGLNQVKWSPSDVDFSNFKTISTTVPATFTKETGVEVIDLSKIGRLPNADSSKLYLLEKVAVNSYRGGETIDVTSGESLTYSYNGQTLSVPGNKVSVSPYGPRILIKQSLYSVNGVPVADSLYLKSDDSKLFIVTKLEAINVGSDLSEKTIISIHPGPFYSVLVDSLKSNITFANGLISTNFGALIPGETKAAYIYYTVNQTVTTKDDLMTVIKLSDIEYEGTSVKSKFKYTDPQKVLFEMYDFQITDAITVTPLGNRKFNITAKAVNRGLPATNVWLRIYPVFNGGISEFFIAEKKIENYGSGETVELTLNDYVAPNGQKVEVVAKIDDGNKIKELIEQNNVKVGLLTSALDVNDLKRDFGVNVYPNPFTSFVQFAYNLPADFKDVKIAVYSQSGKELVNFIHCPSVAGSHVIGWNPQLAVGNYIYRISVTDKNNNVSEIPGILIKTED